MGHLMGPCDFLDVLEEAAVMGTAVSVQLRDGTRFTDTVRDVETEDGEDYAVFRDHGRLPLGGISAARRSSPMESSYEAKLGQ